MTHLGNRPSLLARVVSEARSQEARVQVYAPPKPSCVTLEQQLSLFGLRERERAKEVLGSEGSFREGRAAGSLPCCCFLKDPGLLASQAPSTKLASENHVPYAEWEERKLRSWTLPYSQSQARPVSAEPCFHCLASHRDWRCGRVLRR